MVDLVGGRVEGYESYLNKLFGTASYGQFELQPVPRPEPPGDDPGEPNDREPEPKPMDFVVTDMDHF